MCVRRTSASRAPPQTTKIGSVPLAEHTPDICSTPLPRQALPYLAARSPDRAARRAASCTAPAATLAEHLAEPVPARERTSRAITLRRQSTQRKVTVMCVVPARTVRARRAVPVRRAAPRRHLAEQPADRRASRSKQLPHATGPRTGERGNARGRCPVAAPATSRARRAERGTARGEHVSASR